MSEGRAGLLPLNCDRDAGRWAREFNETIVDLHYQPFDEGFLIAWFANAMMCGEDTFRWRKEKEQSPAGQTVEVAVELPEIHRWVNSDSFKHCPKCGGHLDEGYECTSCGYDFAALHSFASKGAAPQSAVPADSQPDKVRFPNVWQAVNMGGIDFEAIKRELWTIAKEEGLKPSMLEPTHPGDDALDAARYRWLRDRVSGQRDELSPQGQDFVLQPPDVMVGQNIMQGSIAQHLDDAIDAAREGGSKA